MIKREDFDTRRNALGRTILEHAGSKDTVRNLCLQSIAESLIDITEQLSAIRVKMK